MMAEIFSRTPRIKIIAAKSDETIKVFLSMALQSFAGP
jgi:hypothetical protein